jgi:hypothetical protein
VATQYKIEVRYMTRIGKPAYWFGEANTLDEAKTVCVDRADFYFGEGLITHAGRLIAISNSGAPCESPRTLVRRPKSH